MRLPPLCAILDVELTVARGWTVPELARAYLAGGCRWLQVRGKRVPSGRLLELADAVVALAADTDAIVLVNDRPDVARLANAAGVHVGQTDLPPGACRALLGPDAIVGLSTHSRAEADAALVEEITYVATGPVFATGTKLDGGAPVGLERVGYVSVRAREVAARDEPLPVVAIGGITLERAPSVLRAGATAVAVVSDLLTGGNPAARTAAFVRALGG